jgi:hypothetical protein
VPVTARTALDVTWSVVNDRDDHVIVQTLARAAPRLNFSSDLDRLVHVDALGLA